MKHKMREMNDFDFREILRQVEVYMVAEWIGSDNRDIYTEVAGDAIKYFVSCLEVAKFKILTVTDDAA